MKPTNYHLFDFMDFDLDLSKDESLWKACKPTDVYDVSFAMEFIFDLCEIAFSRVWTC